MDHEEIAKKAAEAIMQRANDTYPRTLHKDMLVDEIAKAIKEATKWKDWPPPVCFGAREYSDLASLAEVITSSHDRSRKKLEQHLADYYGKPND